MNFPELRSDGKLYLNDMRRLHRNIPEESTLPIKISNPDLLKYYGEIKEKYEAWTEGASAVERDEAAFYLHDLFADKISASFEGKKVPEAALKAVSDMQAATWYSDMRYEYEDMLAKNPFACAAERIFEKYGDDFFVKPGTMLPAPGTKHHGNPGGLAEHALGVASLTQLAEDVDRDFVTFIALVHDIGKCVESPETCARGLFHSEIGMNIVADELENLGFNSKTVRKAAQCMASHHGSIGNGAMEEPKSPEAFVLAGADRLDGSIMLTAMNSSGTPPPWQEGCQDEWRDIQDEWIKNIHMEDKSEQKDAMFDFIKNLPEDFLALDFVQESIFQINPDFGYEIYPETRQKKAHAMAM